MLGLRGKSDHCKDSGKTGKYPSNFDTEKSRRVALWDDLAHLQVPLNNVYLSFLG